MAVDERDASTYAEHRKLCSDFLITWEKLTASVARYDALGGQTGFEDFFAQDPPPTVTSDEFYGSMVSINQIKGVMDAGAYVALQKVRG